MTRQPLLYLTTVLILFSCNQADKNNLDENKFTCDWGTREANKDISNDSLFLIAWGLPEPSRQTYFELLNQHGIYVKFTGDGLIDEGVKCYNKIMTEKIHKIHGKDFLTKTVQQADSIYNATYRQTK